MPRSLLRGCLLNPSRSMSDFPFADPGKDFGENDFRLKRLADKINRARTQGQGLGGDVEQGLKFARP